MIEFGVVDALQFDSGGSATFYYKNFINEKKLQTNIINYFLGILRKYIILLIGFEN